MYFQYPYTHLVTAFLHTMSGTSVSVQKEALGKSGTRCAFNPPFMYFSPYLYPMSCIKGKHFCSGIAKNKPRLPRLSKKKFTFILHFQKTWRKSYVI
jgi:hypothetical protein